MWASILCLTLAAEPGAFPLPAIDGKTIAPSNVPNRFRLPTRFDKVRSFYEQHFKGDKGISVTLARGDGGRLLTLVSRRPAELWAKALIREGNGETVIDVVPVLRGEHISLEGTPPKPSVQFIFGRDPAAAGAAAAIDHTDVLLKR
jgi:hypothetical protein